MATEKRLIDANAAKARSNSWSCKSHIAGMALAKMNELLDSMPTVDAVEVVRCKDCFADGCCSVQIDLEMGGDGYCSKGKQKNKTKNS